MLPTKKTYLLLILFFLLQTSLPAFAQNISIHLDQWVKCLNAEGDTLSKNFDNIVNVLLSLDTPIAFSTLNELENKDAGAGTLFPGATCGDATDCNGYLDLRYLMQGLIEQIPLLPNESLSCICSLVIKE